MSWVDIKVCEGNFEKIRFIKKISLYVSLDKNYKYSNMKRKNFKGKTFTKDLFKVINIRIWMIWYDIMYIQMMRELGFDDGFEFEFVAHGILFFQNYLWNGQKLNSRFFEWLRLSAHKDQNINPFNGIKTGISSCAVVIVWLWWSRGSCDHSNNYIISSSYKTQIN